MSKCRSSRKRLSDHLEIEHVTKKPKHSRYNQIDILPSKSQSKYKHCNILPDVKELHMKHKISPQVRPLIDKGSYDNWQHYLSMQFNLLREDFVAPLRETVLQYENGNKISHTKVFQQATFTGMVLNEDGLLLSVEFKTSTSEKLINGTLMCFSSDNFKTILFATVVNHREENQMEQYSNQGRYTVDQVIQVKVESDMDNLSILGINKNGYTLDKQLYTIIEAPAHYETYYHVLKSLQNANPQEMPFTDYLVNCRHKVRHPQYLTNVHFNMKEVLKSRSNNSSCFDITNKNCWPSHNVEVLDEFQFKALQHALTHEVALIQGPPGTGKTYIGGKIMEALLINKDKWDPDGNSPVLVVCYTNQALDQFFEKLIDIKSKQANSQMYYHGGLGKELKCDPHEIVRIGGGCSEKVKDNSFTNLRPVDWKKNSTKKEQSKYLLKMINMMIFCVLKRVNLRSWIRK